jgi:hypothetical protein
LQRPQGRADRVEHVQQQQRDILIHVQQTIAGPIPRTADLVESLQQARNGLEVLEPLQLVLLDFVPFRLHARHFRQGKSLAQGENGENVKNIY